MPTSGTSSINATRDVIVRRALRLTGAFASTDLPRPEQLNDAITVLNSMLKTWSTVGFLWLRRFVTVPLVAGQSEYLLGPATDIDRPTHIFNATRKTTDGYEVPIEHESRSGYMAIPNKLSTGVPVKIYYDPQTTNGTLYVWPTPQAGTTDVIVLDVDRQIDVMTASVDEFDLPPHWVEVLSHSLAARLAPEYGMPLGERQLLAQEATALFQSVVNDDRDMSSVYFQVRTR